MGKIIEDKDGNVVGYVGGSCKVSFEKEPANTKRLREEAEAKEAVKEVKPVKKAAVKADKPEA